MAISVSDAVKTGFGSLKSDVGQKLIGIFFVIQAVNFGSTILMESATLGLQMLGGVLMVAAALVSIAATIGGLRSFREGSLKQNLFRRNLLKPFFRVLGANLTTAVFAYMLGFIFLLPAFIAVLAGTAGSLASLGSTGATGAAALGGAGIAAMVLGALGFLLGLVAAIYVTVTLVLSQPLIAIDDKRMFQALDESIQRTKGSRLKIFLAGLSIFAVYLIAAFAGGIVSLVNEQAGAGLIQLVVVPVFTPIFLSVLNYFSEELPLE